MGTTVTVLFDAFPIFHAGVGTMGNGQPPPPRNRCPPVHLYAISLVILASQKINFSA
jgi:hypothetical protein